MSTHDKNDKLLSNIMKDVKETKAPDHFTDMLMEKITAAPKSSPLLSNLHWMLIGLAFVITAAVVLTFDIPMLDNFFGSIQLNQINLETINTDFLLKFVNLFSGIQIPSLAIIAGFAVVSLIVLDRILRKRLQTAQLFLFY